MSLCLNVHKNNKLPKLNAKLLKRDTSMRIGGKQSTKCRRREKKIPPSRICAIIVFHIYLQIVFTL